MTFNLFSGVAFFAASLGMATYLVVLKKVQSLKNGYGASVALISVAFAIYLYGYGVWKPALLLAVASSALFLLRRGILAKRWAVIMTLTPLVLEKVTNLPVLGMVGLSFATFRAVDVLLSADRKQEFSPLEYIAYLFFPLTILAGPMYRWQTFCKDMREGYSRINLDSSLLGLESLLLGVAQKFLIADMLDRFILSNLPARDYSAFGIVIAAVTYSAFLYFDFAGYSNMATGIGRMLGLNLPRNFNNPIAARNPQDFWRRWHISLSEWLRDVVFIPVYMYLCKRPFFSKHRLFAQNIGIFITLLIMGIWNGLSRHYVVSGMLFGLYSVVFNMMVHYSKSVPLLERAFRNPFLCFVGRITTVLLAILALYVFSGRSRI